MGYQNFFELDVWKKARKFKLSMYELISRLPDHEKHELISQLRRSARSIPANISEGHGRRTIKDQLSYCIIARGSLSETLNHLVDAYDSGYIDSAQLLNYKSEWDELRKVLNGYMSYLQSRSPGNGKAQNIEEDAASYAAAEIAGANDNGDLLKQLNEPR